MAGGVATVWAHDTGGTPATSCLPGEVIKANARLWLHLLPSPNDGHAAVRACRKPCSKQENGRALNPTLDGQTVLSSASHQLAVLSIFHSGVAPVQSPNDAQVPGVLLQLADPGADRT